MLYFFVVVIIVVFGLIYLSYMSFLYDKAHQLLKAKDAKAINLFLSYWVLIPKRTRDLLEVAINELEVENYNKELIDYDNRARRLAAYNARDRRMLKK